MELALNAVTENKAWFLRIPRLNNYLVARVRITPSNFGGVRCVHLPCPESVQELHIWELPPWFCGTHSLSTRGVTMTIWNRSYGRTQSLSRVRITWNPPTLGACAECTLLALSQFESYTFKNCPHNSGEPTFNTRGDHEVSWMCGRTCIICACDCHATDCLPLWSRTSRNAFTNRTHGYIIKHVDKHCMIYVRIT